MTHIAILGAGITGVTTAYVLARRGYRVTVLDRHRYAAMETSYANGGQLSASNSAVWNSTATILNGLRWMLQRDAPLLINPSPSWHKYAWMAEFVSNIPHYRQNTIDTTRMAIEARRLLFAIAERENISFDLERRGILHVHHDKPGFENGLRVNALLNEGGLERFPVTPLEIAELEPTLHGSFYGGFFTPSDATGDIHKFTRGLATACVRRGVSFLYEAHVDDIVPLPQGFDIRWRCAALPDENGATDCGSSLHVDGLVICAGTASHHFARTLGDRLNVYPVKGYSITIPLDSDEARRAAPHVSLLDESVKIVTSRLGADRFRVAGTAEFNGYNRDIRSDRILPLVNWTRAHFPDMPTSSVVPWAGLRPMMPNMMPVVRAGKRPGIFYNTGHGHLGWTLSAATAEMLGDVVDMTALRPESVQRLSA
jgi:D-amino-acid dehydrogenase